MINLMVFDGMILMWFILTTLSVLFVAVDISNTPEDPVLKWGFILLTAYIGPFGVFLYVLGCREPLPGLHEQYISARWRQVLGSTMHCVAGDGIGLEVMDQALRRGSAAGACCLSFPLPRSIWSKWVHRLTARRTRCM